MSVDFSSVCISIPASTARDVFGTLAPKQWCGALIGPDEETVVDGWTGLRQLDLASIAKQYAGERPALEHWEGAAVDLPEELLELIDPQQGLVMTNRSSALAGLDRVLAIRFGVDLLCGHAIAHIPCNRIDVVRLGLARLWKQLAGRGAAAGTLQPYLFGNANGDATEQIIAAVESALTRAKANKEDVLLMSAVS